MIMSLSLLRAGTGLGHCLPNGDLDRTQKRPGCSNDWHVQLGRQGNKGWQGLPRSGREAGLS